MERRVVADVARKKATRLTGVLSGRPGDGEAKDGLQVLPLMRMQLWGGWLVRMQGWKDSN